MSTHLPFSSLQASEVAGSLSSANYGGLSSSSSTPTSLPQGSPTNSVHLSSPPISVSHKSGISFPFLASSGQLAFSVKPSTAGTLQTSSLSTVLPKPTNLNTSAAVVANIPSPRVTSSAAPIQPGMVTPLPPGLNLEALAKLCSLPESELMKHNLPPSLLTAIKVWKLQQKSDSHHSSLFKSVVSTLCYTFI